MVGEDSPEVDRFIDEGRRDCPKAERFTDQGGEDLPKADRLRDCSADFLIFTKGRVFEDFGDYCWVHSGVALASLGSKSGSLSLPSSSSSSSESSSSYSSSESESRASPVKYNTARGTILSLI